MDWLSDPFGINAKYTKIAQDAHEQGMKKLNLCILVLFALLGLFSLYGLPFRKLRIKIEFESLRGEHHSLIHNAISKSSVLMTSVVILSLVIWIVYMEFALCNVVIGALFATPIISKWLE